MARISSPVSVSTSFCGVLANLARADTFSPSVRAQFRKTLRVRTYEFTVKVESRSLRMPESKKWAW